MDIPPARFPAAIAGDRRSDVTHRRSSIFNPQLMIVNPYSATAGNIQRVVPANRFRIGFWCYSTTFNSNLIVIGGPNLSQLPGQLGGTQGFDCEPGTGWWIDDTWDAIYAYAAGANPLALEFYESVDFEAMAAARQ